LSTEGTAERDHSLSVADPTTLSPAGAPWCSSRARLRQLFLLSVERLQTAGTGKIYSSCANTVGGWEVHELCKRPHTWVDATCREPCAPARRARPSAGPAHGAVRGRAAAQSGRLHRPTRKRPPSPSPAGPVGQARPRGRVLVPGCRGASAPTRPARPKLCRTRQRARPLTIFQFNREISLTG